MVCDLTKEEDIKAAFAWVEQNWGAVNILVNNAGLLILKDLEGDLILIFNDYI